MKIRYEISTFDDQGDPEYTYWVYLGDELELSCKGRSKIILKREPPEETYTAHEAHRTILRRVSFDDVSLDELADFVRMRSRDIRPPGLDIVLIPPTIGLRRITELRLQDASVATYMRYVAEMTSTMLTFEDDAIVLRDGTESDNTLHPTAGSVPL